MSKPTVKQMKANIDTLAAVCKRITQELDMLKTIVMGDHQVIKKLSEFPEIIEELKKEQENGETDTSGTASGDQSSSDTNE